MTADGLTKARTVARLAEELARALDECGIAEPVSEAREIVAALFDVPRFWSLTNGHVEVDDTVRTRARIAVERRAQGAPFAYAVGRASFRHLTLEVDERVLIPRAETEHLVDLVLEDLGQERGGVAVDVGTGSGAHRARPRDRRSLRPRLRDRHLARRARRRASERGVGPPLVASDGRSRAWFAAPPATRRPLPSGGVESALHCAERS